jgi:hypothetical protein
VDYTRIDYSFSIALNSLCVGVRGCALIASGRLSSFCYALASVLANINQ